MNWDQYLGVELCFWFLVWFFWFALIRRSEPDNHSFSFGMTSVLVGLFRTSCTYAVLRAYRAIVLFISSREKGMPPVQFVERNLKNLFSDFAINRVCFLCGAPNVSVKLFHEKLMEFSKNENGKKFWLLHNTLDALGFERNLLKSNHANIRERYAKLADLEEKFGPIAREKILKGSHDLWFEITKEVRDRKLN